MIPVGRKVYASAESSSKAVMAKIVLVHGAWHGAWCWEKLARELGARGHRVAAPDMPGHGDDPTPLAEVNLAAYTKRIVDTLETLDEPAVLLGHSMGGMLISTAAEAAPERVSKLIYLCAFVPKHGESLNAVAAQTNRESTLRDHISVVDDGLATVVADAALQATFYHDCDAADVARAKARLVPQAQAPMRDKAALSAGRFGRVPKAYIECLQDAAIPIVAQRLMIERGGITEVVTLDTSHSPFLSAPRALADAIESLL